LVISFAPKKQLSRFSLAERDVIPEEVGSFIQDSSSIVKMPSLLDFAFQTPTSTPTSSSSSRLFTFNGVKSMTTPSSTPSKLVRTPSSSKVAGRMGLTYSIQSGDDQSLLKATFQAWREYTRKKIVSKLRKSLAERERVLIINFRKLIQISTPQVPTSPIC
jgi:hypothetical protein